MVRRLIRKAVTLQPLLQRPFEMLRIERDPERIQQGACGRSWPILRNDTGQQRGHVPAPLPDWLNLIPAYECLG
ncbi:hypothetical protein DQX05_13470 [Paenibacillus thiaminolyticus]|uniref:Uncharacterized protein n=1 Tax=Paenibacillus thiaminolyticus TaxID=49283 RepID=A0A3A3GHB8_PANTH|nr:hypothetical protein DQX05_13470 [Paenibacillus thiaminolyticus]